MSSHEQKKTGDLGRQQEALREYSNKENLNIDSEISDVVSSLSGKRLGIMRLFKMVTKGKISQVIINYRDRLTRFGFAYLDVIKQNK